MMGGMQEVHWEDDFKRVAKRQQALQRVLLVEWPEVIQKPLGRIVERREDIVDVNMDAGLQRRKYLEQLVNAIALRFHNVRRVDKENIVLSKAREGGERDILDFLF